MAVDEKFEFTAHESTKDGSAWVYCCKYRLTPKVRCGAKARVILFNDKWILKSVDENHKCEPNRAKVTAELLRARMKSLVRKDPVKAVGKAVRAVRIQAADEYGEDEDFYQNLIAELGTDAALEKQMLRVRLELIGPTPHSRNLFDPEQFLSRIYGEKCNVIVCDSNKLDDTWRDSIDKHHSNNDYDWSKLTDDMLNIEQEHHIEEEINEEDTEVSSGEEMVDDLSERDLPKRILAFSTRKLLQQLGNKLKSSVDGTFKSSCSLWGQMFVWMVKLRKGYWVPTVWGWLPDKTLISYKVFFHLIEEKMKELGFKLDVESVLSDFELNIMKSIDVMLKCPILGCFFHHKKCFQRKVDKKGFKTRYENDEHFQAFINQCSALSSLPLDDLEEGLEHINKKIVFEDERAQNFKEEFLKYISDFWIHGCLPPRTWNTFGRSDDFTNNNQEGYNSKFNKELKETHPSPGILLCHIKEQITLAEEKLVRVKAGVKKPAQRVTYRNLAESRLRLKKNYLDSRKRGEAGAIGDFLTSMGYNVKSATMSGRIDDYEESQSKSTPNDVENLDVSNWVPSNENSVLEELQCEDPYSHRKVGEKEKVPWRNKKCPSCKLGFNTKSTPIKCDGCDSFTHKKNTCLRDVKNKNQFFCKVCSSTENSQEQVKETSQSKACRVDGGFKCERCGIIVKSYYSLKRHIGRIHSEDEVNREMVESNTIEVADNLELDKVVENNVDDISSFLSRISLQQYLSIFMENDIDLDVLMDLRQEEFMDMVKDLGIHSWAHRHKLKRAIEDKKSTIADVTAEKTSKEVDNLEDDGRSNSGGKDGQDNIVIEETFKEPYLDVTAEKKSKEVDNLEDDGRCNPRGKDGQDNVVIEETFKEPYLDVTCDLCMIAKEHLCRKCYKPVCNFGCSVQDPSSDNEMHRVHKRGDTRCLPSYYFECPMCGNSFKTAENLQNHISAEHEQDSSLSLISEASSGWMDETEKDQTNHPNLEELLMEHHIDDIDVDNTLSEHENPPVQTHKRIVQNLKDVNFEDDSDEDNEWNPTGDEEEDEFDIEYCCNKCKYKTKHEHMFKKHMLTQHKSSAQTKRKIACDIVVPNKRKKDDVNESDSLVCDVCKTKFTRRDNLKRHKLKKH